MYINKKTIVVSGVTINELWCAHADINNWAKWQKEIEWTKVEGEVGKGTKFLIKPKGSPKVKLQILTFNKPYQFTDVSMLPFCKMYTTTKMFEVANGIEITLEIKMRGMLTFLWKNLIAEKILAAHQEQNENMIDYIKNRQR